MSPPAQCPVMPLSYEMPSRLLSVSVKVLEHPSLLPPPRPRPHQAPGAELQPPRGRPGPAHPQLPAAPGALVLSLGSRRVPSSVCALAGSRTRSQAAGAPLLCSDRCGTPHPTHQPAPLGNKEIE